MENNEQFSEALPVLNKLEHIGFDAFFVGGCVRDFLLQRKIKDIDITTSATPEQVMEIFPKVIPVGIDHGTVIVRNEKKSYEVTTFRNKLADEETFSFGHSLAEDLLYRDFTMNALAMDKLGNITDLFDGQIHLQNRTIKAVKDPYMRFKEDPLRMVRACRFVSQLGFSIEDDTIQAIKQLNEDIQQVAIERLKDEVTTLITGQHYTEGLRYLIQTGLIEQFPIFKRHTDYIQLLQKEPERFTSFSHMLAFLHELQPKVSLAKWVKEWNGSNKEKRLAKQLSNAIRYYKEHGVTLWLVYQLDKALHKPFMQIIDTIYKETITVETLQTFRNKLMIQSKQDLVIDGHILMKWFPNRKPGAWIKQMIEAIEFAVVMNELKNDELLIKEWITCHPLATD